MLDLPTPYNILRARTVNKNWSIKRDLFHNTQSVNDESEQSTDLNLEI
jgi:hypothetical protein